jgi:hypothetical protein
MTMRSWHRIGNACAMASLIRTDGHYEIGILGERTTHRDPRS